MTSGEGLVYRIMRVAAWTGEGLGAVKVAARGCVVVDCLPTSVAYLSVC